jgi:hypothetical protein
MSDFEKRLSQAQSLETSPDVLAELAKDTRKEIRYAVARNLSTPLGVLIKLQSDSAKWVRFWAAYGIWEIASAEKTYEREEII